MGKGIIPAAIGATLIAFLFITAVVAELALLCMSRSNKFGATYLKPGTFYAYALCMGGVIGVLFQHPDIKGEEALQLGQIVMSAFVYTMGIFVSLSFFALITIRRAVNRFY